MIFPIKWRFFMKNEAKMGKVDKFTGLPAGQAD